MDSFSEQIIKQALDAKRLLIIIGVVTVAIAACVASAIFAPWMLVPLLGLGGFGVYWVVSSQSWEVEYAVTNGDIDIDRIVARRDRKTIVRVRGAKILSLLPVSDEILNKPYARVVMAARTSASATWTFTYKSKQGLTLVLFEPSDDVLGALRDGLPRLVQIETDRALRNH